jgi:hypothetical protein
LKDQARLDDILKAIVIDDRGGQTPTPCVNVLKADVAGSDVDLASDGIKGW